MNFKRAQQEIIKVRMNSFPGAIPPSSKITFNKKVPSSLEVFKVWIHGDRFQWRAIIQSDVSWTRIEGIEGTDEEPCTPEHLYLSALLDVCKWIPRTSIPKTISISARNLYLRNLLSDWLEIWKQTDFCVEEDHPHHIPVGKKRKHRMDRPVPEPAEEVKQPSGPRIDRPHAPMLRHLVKIMEEKKMKCVVHTLPDPSDETMAKLLQDIPPSIAKK